MNAPVRDAFDCPSQKPMRRRFVSGFPKALLSLSQEKSSGAKIEKWSRFNSNVIHVGIREDFECSFEFCQNSVGVLDAAWL